MRTPTIVVLLLVLTLLAPGTNGQGDSGEFVSGIARFGFTPGVPIADAKSLEARQGPFIMLGESFSFADQSTAFVITHYTPFEPKKFGGDFSAASKISLTAMFRKDFIADFQKSNATFIDSAFTSGAVKGTEFRITGARRSILRMFFVGNRFYILLATSLNKPEFGQLSTTLDTFRHLPKDEFAAAMIREAMPAQLPQTTPSGILPTDALEMGLKGRVKAIIEHIESGTPKKRERNAEFHFGLTGFLTRHITYAVGLADVISNYGWVDGRRSVNVAPIKYFGEPFSFARSAMTVGIGAREGYNYLGRDLNGQIVDNRYTSRFQEKYDDSWRLTERQNISSSGDINFVEKHVYRDRSRTVLVEDNAGGFISGKSEVLDAAGNVVEENTLDNTGKPTSTMRFEYQFDSKRNWIVKTATVRWKGSGPKGFRIYGTYYRTISYYD
jgi:hypothetical protein